VFMQALPTTRARDRVVYFGRGQRRTGSTGDGTVVFFVGRGSGSSGEWGEERLSVSGAGSPQQSGSPPTTSQRGSARSFGAEISREEDGSWVEDGSMASSSDASSQPEAVASPRSSSKIHTHTHTRANSLHTTRHHHVSLFHLVPLSLCTACTTPSFSFSLPLRTGPHRHPCAVRAISAASGHSNKHQQRNAARPEPACVSASQRFPRLRSACLCSACVC
jgi:hypothetical protein